MKIGGWRRPNDAKALNHTEKENPTTVFNMLDRVLHNGSKCVFKKICVSYCLHVRLHLALAGLVARTPALGTWKGLTVWPDL